MKFTRALKEYKRGTLMKRSAYREWTVQESFQWYIDYEAKTGLIVVGGGFVTDLGSVPRPLWWLLNPTEYMSYILHDYLYHTRGYYMDNADHTIKSLTRKQVDKIFYDALLAEGCSKCKACLKYLGVRIGGWWSWGKPKQ